MRRDGPSPGCGGTCSSNAGSAHRAGLFLLDEPESALSFTGCLALVSHLTTLVRTTPSQVLLSTHSPVLAAIPGATIYEVGDWGLRRCEWDSLELVQRYRGFLDDPRRYFRHVIEDPAWLT